MDGAGTEELLKLSSAAAGNTNNALRQMAVEVFESMNGRARSQSMNGPAAVVGSSYHPMAAKIVDGPLLPPAMSVANMQGQHNELDYSVSKRPLIPGDGPNKKTRA